MPFAAGGGTDLLARLVAEGLGKRLGQSFVTLNRPGGNTNTGTLQVVKSPPDGHTLVMASIGLAANPSLYRKLAFDPLADLAPISLLANSPTVLVVPPDLPVNSVGGVHRASEGASRRAELRLLRRRQRAASGDRAVPLDDRRRHRPRAVFRRRAGRGRRDGQQRADAVRQRAAGAGRWFAAASSRPSRSRPAERSPLLPDVPTFKEGGLDYRTGTWFGLLAPARTPDAHRRDARTGRWPMSCEEPAVRDRIVEQGAEVVGNTPAEFRAFLKEETERLAVVVRNAKMQLD